MSLYFRIFGVGPAGLLGTVVFWATVIIIEDLLNIPEMTMPAIVRDLLAVFFGADMLYLIGGSLLIVKPSKIGKTVFSRGPYRFIRHPIYSAVLYSGTGLSALYWSSWGLILSVVPLSVFWSWLVIREENFMLNRFGRKYQEYINNTGQFFPKMQMKDSLNSVDRHDK